MPDRIVISNTTPIIALVQRLDLLHALYGEVWIPPAVAAELRAGGARAGAAELATASCSGSLDCTEKDDVLY